MTNILKYPALNAKMKGMYANHLNSNELEELLKQSSLKEAIYFLKNKFSSLENINEQMTSKEIEQELNNLFIINILKLFKYLSKNEIKIFMQFLAKYEINCVKNVFRNVVTNRDSKEYLKNVDNWTNKIFNSIDGINKVTTENNFFEIIESEEYYTIFKEYESIIKEVPLEELEVKLDQFYFKKLFELASKTNKEFEKIVGIEIDLLNITWIYRAKKYFNYDKNEIQKILIPCNYRISKKVKEKLLDISNFDELKSVLSTTIYKNVFNLENTLEHDKDKFLYNEYLKIFRMKIFNIATIFCEINLVEIEIKNIINIIEGIRYEIDKKEIQKKIIV